MRKKTESTNKPSVPARRSAQPAAKQPSAARPARAANPKPKRPARPRAATAAAIRTEDVALRAYFISEKRRQQGLPGDEHQDWIEAERQLRDEISAPRNGGKKRASAN